jgi:protein MpaA
VPCSRWLTTAAALVLGGAPTAVPGGTAHAALSPHTAREQHPRPIRADVVRRRILLGRSVEGRPIIAVEVGNPSSTRTVLVVGCIHGDECAGTAITERLLALAPPAHADLWVIPSLNPDGAARSTRGNGRGVDLNRNFPWHWQPLKGLHDSGPRPLSEPESEIAYKLILQLRPVFSIWFHQHLDVVDESGGKLAVERRFAKLVGLPLARLPREPGSVTSWENHALPGAAFVVELPAGELAPAAATRFARAILTLTG